MFTVPGSSSALWFDVSGSGVADSAIRLPFTATVHRTLNSERRTGTENTNVARLRAKRFGEVSP
jgi:hypothetical protein